MVGRQLGTFPSQPPNWMATEPSPYFCAFFDEINNNVCGDGANGCEDDSGYPASPSREALHRMDHKTRPSGNLILVFGPITEHQLCPYPSTGSVTATTIRFLSRY